LDPDDQRVVFDVALEYSTVVLSLEVPRKAHPLLLLRLRPNNLLPPRSLLSHRLPWSHLNPLLPLITKRQPLRLTLNHHPPLHLNQLTLSRLIRLRRVRARTGALLRLPEFLLTVVSATLLFVNFQYCIGLS
jgi:hypothetical protein